MMKKLFAVLALCGSQVVFANKECVFVDFATVIEKAQITADIRREIESSQAKIQSEYQKLNDFCINAEKELNGAAEAAMKSGNLSSTSMDSIKLKEIDVTAKRDSQKCVLQAEQNKLQVTVGGKAKACEERLRTWGQEFGKNKGYLAVMDKKQAVFVSEALDVTNDLVLYCDKQYLAEKKTGELLAANVKNIDLAKKSTVLVENSADKSSKEVVTA